MIVPIFNQNSQFRHLHNEIREEHYTDITEAKQ
jgi:hypothetical protein